MLKIERMVKLSKLVIIYNVHNLLLMATFILTGCLIYCKDKEIDLAEVNFKKGVPWVFSANIFRCFKLSISTNNINVLNDWFYTLDFSSQTFELSILLKK